MWKTNTSVKDIIHHELKKESNIFRGDPPLASSQYISKFIQKANASVKEVIGQTKERHAVKTKIEHKESTISLRNSLAITERLYYAQQIRATIADKSNNSMRSRVLLAPPLYSHALRRGSSPPSPSNT